jgi:hypothetical protein
MESQLIDLEAIHFDGVDGSPRLRTGSLVGFKPAHR